METYNRLGSKTYWYFLSEKLSVATGFFFLAVIISAARFISQVPASLHPFLGLAGVISFAIFIISLIVAFVSATLMYKSHGYALTDDALKIKQGFISEIEIAIPYRQIQNVSIERTFSEKTMGLSRIIISTAGHDDPNTQFDESRGILPAMDKIKAVELQNELLKRADVQKVIQTN